jgi:hypothetical protein
MAVDSDTGDLLDLISDSADLAHHRAEVERAIWATAFDYDGHVNPNHVRRILPTWVKPQAVGPTYRAMVLAGHIQPDGWTTNDDAKGRNSGKPLRTYCVTTDSD